MSNLPREKDEISRLIQSPLPWFLGTIALLSIAVVVRFVSLENARDIQAEFNALAVDTLAGILVSFVFYYLVAVLPERRRKQLIKGNLRKNYLYIKRSLLREVISGSIFGGRSDLDHSLDTLDRLMDVDEFRKEFSGGGEAHEGYYAFANHLQEDSLQFQEILLRLSQLKSQIGLILHNYPFSSSALIERFSFIEMRISRLERSQPGYDSSEPLLSFLFEIFSGWDMIQGYRATDYVLEAIDQL